MSSSNEDSAIINLQVQKDSSISNDFQTTVIGTENIVKNKKWSNENIEKHISNQTLAVNELLVATTKVKGPVEKVLAEFHNQFREKFSNPKNMQENNNKKTELRTKSSEVQTLAGRVITKLSNFKDQLTTLIKRSPSRDRFMASLSSTITIDDIDSKGALSADLAPSFLSTDIAIAGENFWIGPPTIREIKFDAHNRSHSKSIPSHILLAHKLRKHRRTFRRISTVSIY